MNVAWMTELTTLKRRIFLLRLKGVGRVLVLLVVVAAPVPRAAAQESDTGGVVPWTRLTSIPRLRPDSAVPGVRYPAMLRSANVGGEVEIELFVDVDGRPIWERSRVVRASHDLFRNSVRTTMTRWAFTPPMIDERAVATLAPLLVSFDMPAEHDVPVRQLAEEVLIDSSGIHLTLGWEIIPRDSIRIDTMGVFSAKSIVLRELLETADDLDSLAAVCVRWDRGRAASTPPAMVLRRLRLHYPTVRTPDRCPRTYASMVSHVDSLGRPTDRRPKGAIDPVWVEVDDVQQWTAELYIMTGYVWQGTLTHRYYCEAQRDEYARWSATCELRSTTLS